MRLTLRSGSSICRAIALSLRVRSWHRRVRHTSGRELHASAVDCHGIAQAERPTSLWHRVIPHRARWAPVAARFLAPACEAQHGHRRCAGLPVQATWKRATDASPCDESDFNADSPGATRRTTCARAAKRPTGIQPREFPGARKDIENQFELGVRQGFLQHRYGTRDALQCRIVRVPGNDDDLWSSIAPLAADDVQLQRTVLPLELEVEQEQVGHALEFGDYVEPAQRIAVRIDLDAEALERPLRSLKDLFVVVENRRRSVSRMP